MASAQSTGSLQDMVECCICVDEFTDPRMLPCIHTFCLACLEKIGKDKQPGEIMPCPLCRSAFKIPVDGFQGIQKNFFVQSLLDMHRLSTVDSTKAFCEACSEDDSVEETSIASVICIECCQKLCDLCCRYHKRHKLSKQHQLVNLENVETISRLSKKFAQSFCDHHNNEQIKMYCFDCESTNCLVCQFESHQGHKCSDVEKASQHFCLQLEEVNKKMLCSFNSSKAILTKLDVDNCCLSEKIASLQLDVKKQAEMLKRLVDEHANQLFSEIDSIKASNLKQIENKKEEVGMLSTMLESLRRYSSEIQEKGSAVEICRNFLEIKARSDELERSHTALKNSTSNPKDDCFCFSPSNFEKFRKSAGNLVGNIGFMDSTAHMAIDKSDLSLNSGNNSFLDSTNNFECLAPDEPWLTSEDFNLSSLLNGSPMEKDYLKASMALTGSVPPPSSQTFAQAMNQPFISEGSRGELDVDSTLDWILNINNSSLDYASKFAELAASRVHESTALKNAARSEGLPPGI